MPVYRKVELTRELFNEIWGLERHLVRLERIEGNAFSGQNIDANQINSETDYSETLLLTALGIVKENHDNGEAILDEYLLREIHQAIQDAFSTMYPHVSTESIPREADEFYHRGNTRIAQTRYDEAITDFVQANKMKPNNPVYEFAIGQYWFQYGHVNQTALLWTDKAISHLDAEAVCERVFYNELRTDICTDQGNHKEAIRSLQTSTEHLRFLVEALEWKNGEASLGEGRIMYAEGVQHSLSQATESAEQLLTLVDATVVPHLQAILKILRKLFKQL
jgi:tetratricopeptide (TPR) repeat protein